jgi:hypothetical protein
MRESLLQARTILLDGEKARWFSTTTSKVSPNVSHHVIHRKSILLINRGDLSEVQYIHG